MMPSRWALELCWAGWFKLAQRYPDQGPLGDAAWHWAVFWIDLKAFGVVASANHHGLRVALRMGPCAIFFPWPSVAVSAQRTWLNTVIRIAAHDLPGVALTIAADDEIADDLLRPA